MSALKKIEEKHTRKSYHDRCPACLARVEPCNVVKLARALAKFGNTPDEDGDRSVECTLKEVAGV